MPDRGGPADQVPPEGGTDHVKGTGNAPVLARGDSGEGQADSREIGVVSHGWMPLGGCGLPNLAVAGPPTSFLIPDCCDSCAAAFGVMQAGDGTRLPWRALSRCTMRSRRTAAYPRQDRAPTISRSVAGRGWVCSRSLQEGQVQPGQLERQGGGDGGGQGGVGQGARADPRAGGDGELGRAQGEEGHALPGPAGGLAPQGHAEGHRGDDHANPGDPRPQPGPQDAFGGGRGGRRITPGSAGSLPSATPGRPWVSRLTHKICAGSSPGAGRGTGRRA